MDTQPMFWRRALPSCSGPGCNQGRAPCPTPEACRLVLPVERSEFGLPFPGLKTPPDSQFPTQPAGPQFTRRVLTFLGIATFAIVCAIVNSCSVA